MQIEISISKDALGNCNLIAAARVPLDEKCEDLFSLFSTTVNDIVGKRKRYWRLKPSAETYVSFEENRTYVYFRARASFLDELGDEISGEGGEIGWTGTITPITGEVSNA